MQVDLGGWSSTALWPVAVAASSETATDGGGLASRGPDYADPVASATLLTRENGGRPLLGRHNPRVGVMGPAPEVVDPVDVPE